MLNRFFLLNLFLQSSNDIVFEFNSFRNAFKRTLCNRSNPPQTCEQYDCTYCLGFDVGAMSISAANHLLRKDTDVFCHQTKNYRLVFKTLLSFISIRLPVIKKVVLRPGFFSGSGFAVKLVIEKQM